MRILLVEDDRSLTRGLVATLKAAAMVVDAVETGEEALEYCRLYDFDMVLRRTRPCRTWRASTWSAACAPPASPPRC